MRCLGPRCRRQSVPPAEFRGVGLRAGWNGNVPDHGNAAAFRARPWPNPNAPCAANGFAFAGSSITVFFVPSCAR